MEKISEDIDYLFNKINWGSSFLDAKAVGIMNTLKSNIQKHTEVSNEVLKIWNEDGENGEIQMKTPIAWQRAVSRAERANGIEVE